MTMSPLELLIHLHTARNVRWRSVACFSSLMDFNQVVEWYSILSVADEDSLRDLLDVSRSISSYTRGQAARSAIISKIRFLQS